MKNKNCPICEKNMIHSERYPNMICEKCCNKTLTRDGESIEFYNIDHTGGFISIVNNIKGKIHECYVDNHKCYADESRFGGIVIQLS